VRFAIRRTTLSGHPAVERCSRNPGVNLIQIVVPHALKENVSTAFMVNSSPVCILCANLGDPRLYYWFLDILNL
jgi:hypothetical protein